MRHLIRIAVLSAALVSNGPASAKDSLQDKVSVSKRIEGTRLTKAWKTAKLKCLEMNYTVSNEDREIRTIFCTKSNEMGTDSLRITFFDDEFVVAAKGVATGIPLLGNHHKRRKKEMTEALEAVLK